MISLHKCTPTGSSHFGEHLGYRSTDITNILTWESNPYMKVNKRLSVHKCKQTGGSRFVGHLGYRSPDKTHIQTWVRV